MNEDEARCVMFDFDAPDTWFDIRKCQLKMKDADEIWFRSHHPLITMSLDSLDEANVEKKVEKKKRKSLSSRQRIKDGRNRRKTTKNDENNNDDVMRLLKSHNRKVRGIKKKKVLGRKRANSRQQKRLPTIQTKKKKTTIGRQRKKAPTNPKKKRIQPTPSNDEEDLMALLQQHNKKFKSKHTYEPRIHSVRDVKKWEKKHGKKYCSLNVEERKMANFEISAMKKSGQQ